MADVTMSRRCYAPLYIINILQLVNFELHK